MNKQDIKLSTCKYQVTHLQLSIPGESEAYNVEPQYILGMYIENLYDSYLFPYFELTICLPSAIERAMKKTTRDIMASFRVNYGYYENEMGGTGDKNGAILKTDWFSKKFYVFMDDSTPDMMERYKEEYEKDSGTYKKGFTIDQMSFLKIILYNYDYIFKSKKIIDGVLANANVSDVMTYLINSAEMSDILMSPANNNKKYSQFIVTPLSAMEQIQRIAYDYGLHDAGTTIFFDIRRAYILNKLNKATALADNEIKNVYLMAFQESDNNTLAFGCYRNAIEKYCVIAITANSMNVSAQSMIKDQVYGSNIITVDKITGAVTSTTAETNKSSGAYMLSNILVNSNGEDTTKAVKNSLEESNTVVTCNMQGVCLDMLSPNKEFIFSFDSSRFSQYGGNYRLGSTITTFSKEGDLYTPTTKCKFYGNNKK